MEQLLLHASPYDTAATGFYFDDYAEYQQKSKTHKNHYGEKVEEYELQFIDGERLDGELFSALGVHQANLKAFFDTALEWDEWEKILVILATREAGYNFDIETDLPDQFDIDVYNVDSIKELAQDFVEQGLYGDIPSHLEYYIDYDAIARDLSIDYVQTVINGQTIIYRCG